MTTLDSWPDDKCCCAGHPPVEAASATELVSCYACGSYAYIAAIMDAFASKDQSDRSSGHLSSRSTSSLSKKLQDVKKNASDVKEAAQKFAAAGASRQCRAAATRLLDAVFAAEAARMLARLLICCYFINLAYADIEIW
jgi:Flp pilus assembly protein TadB